MPFKKGHKLSGSRKGSENKATKDIKEAYKQLIEKNLNNLTKWLKDIAAKDPAKAIYILSDLSEYVLPKLARSDIDITSKGDSLKEAIANQFKQAFTPPDEIQSESNISN